MFDSITLRLKSLFWLQYHVRLFQLASSVNLLCCQMCTFYCTLRKKRYTLLPEGTQGRIQGTSSPSIDVLFIQQTQRYVFIKCFKQVINCDNKYRRIGLSLRSSASLKRIRGNSSGHKIFSWYFQGKEQGFQSQFTQQC